PAHKLLTNTIITLRSLGREDGIMGISLPDARHLSDEVLEALRLRALRGCELGFTEADVADLLGVARETVSRWWSAYADGGPEAQGNRITDSLGRGAAKDSLQEIRIPAGLAAFVFDPPRAGMSLDECAGGTREQR